MHSHAPGVDAPLRIHEGPDSRQEERRAGSSDRAGVTHVFFDAEGTLWEPRPGRTIHDFWDDPSIPRARRVFERTDGVVDTLEALRRRGLELVVISKHDPDLLPQILDDFGLSPYFSDVIVDDDKGARVAEWLEDHEVSPRQAVMVGDRQEIDIEPLQRTGVVGILIDRRYNRGFGCLRIRRLEDVVPTLAFLSALRSDDQQALKRFVTASTPQESRTNRHA